MDIHLDSHAERLIERQLRAGRFRSPEQVVVSALEVLTQTEEPLSEPGERRQAVRDMLEFADKHGFTLTSGLSIRDLIHEGHKY
jgi:hypothetical protein